MVSVTTLVTLAMVTIFGALVSGLTGLAGGAILMGAYALFLPLEVALTFHSIVQFVSNIARIGLGFKAVRWDIALRYASLIVPGVWVGGWVFQHVSSGTMQIALGILILLSVYLPTPAWDKIKVTKNTFIWVGFFSGILSMLGGAVGTLISALFLKIDLTRQQQIPTKSACQLVLHCSRIVAYASMMDVNYAEVEMELAILMVCSLMGIGLSIPIGKKIDDKLFGRILNALLTLIALQNIYMGLRHLELL